LSHSRGIVGAVGPAPRRRPMIAWLAAVGQARATVTSSPELSLPRGHHRRSDREPAMAAGEDVCGLLQRPRPQGQGRLPRTGEKLRIDLLLSKRVQPSFKFLDSQQQISVSQAQRLSAGRDDGRCGNRLSILVHGHFVDPQHAVTCQHVDISVGSRSPHYPPRNAADVATSVPQWRRAQDRDAACLKVAMSTWIGRR